MGGLFLLVLVIVLAVALFFAISELQNAKELLKRFEPIRNIEKQQARLRAEGERAERALAEQQAKLRAESEALELNIDVLKHEVAEGDAKLARLADRLGAAQRGIDLQEHLDRTIADMKAEVARREERIVTLAERLGGLERAVEVQASLAEYESKLELLRREVESLEVDREVFSFDTRRPRFAFATTAEYRGRLESNYARQKALVKVGLAVRDPGAPDGVPPKGKKLAPHPKLMLRAFNGECDAVIEKVKHGNVDGLQDRLLKSFGEVNTLGESEGLAITNEYLMLKLDELHLAHELQAKLQAERDEQRALNEQARDEERAQRELEEATAEAEREAAIRQEALERARLELAQATGDQQDLRDKVAQLELELKAANEKKERAIAEAQRTKRGNVYVISNIGSFGENCFKIGMTRRLDPFERIDELSNASVPFPFDVHAMIQTDDAPALEAALHRHFAEKRVNKVNMRKEFFYASLEEIRAAALEVHAGTITFTTTPEADAYRQTLALENAPLAGADVTTVVAGPPTTVG